MNNESNPEPAPAAQYKRPRSKSWLWIILAILLTIVTLVVLWWWQQRAVSMVTATCETANLALTIGKDEGVAGTIYKHVIVTNTSKQTCKINGYPKTSLLDAKGEVVEHGVPENNSFYPETVVVLRPHDQAHALLGFPDVGNFDDGDCGEESATLTLHMPGVVFPTTTGPLSVPLVQKACPGYSITAVLPGA